MSAVNLASPGEPRASASSGFSLAAPPAAPAPRRARLFSFFDVPIVDEAAPPPPQQPAPAPAAVVEVPVIPAQPKPASPLRALVDESGNLPDASAVAETSATAAADEQAEFGANRQSHEGVATEEMVEHASGDVHTQEEEGSLGTREENNEDAERESEEPRPAEVSFRRRATMAAVSLTAAEIEAATLTHGAAAAATSVAAQIDPLPNVPFRLAVAPAAPERVRRRRWSVAATARVGKVSSSRMLDEITTLFPRPPGAETSPLYSVPNLLRRDIMRFDPAVQKVLRQFWQALGNSAGTIDWPVYERFHACLARALAPFFDPDMEARSAREDWDTDRGGLEYIDRDRFLFSLFQLADQWTDEISLDESVDFLYRLFRSTTYWAGGRFLVRDAKDVALGCIFGDKRRPPRPPLRRSRSRAPHRRESSVSTSPSDGEGPPLPRTGSFQRRRRSVSAPRRIGAEGSARGYTTDPEAAAARASPRVRALGASPSRRSLLDLVAHRRAATARAAAEGSAPAPPAPAGPPVPPSFHSSFVLSDAGTDPDGGRTAGPSPSPRGEPVGLSSPEAAAAAAPEPHSVAPASPRSSRPASPSGPSQADAVPSAPSPVAAPTPPPPRAHRRPLPPAATSRRLRLLPRSGSEPLASFQPPQASPHKPARPAPALPPLRMPAAPPPARKEPPSASPRTDAGTLSWRRRPRGSSSDAEGAEGAIARILREAREVAQGILGRRAAARYDRDGCALPSPGAASPRSPRVLVL